MNPTLPLAWHTHRGRFHQVATLNPDLQVLYALECIRRAHPDDGTLRPKQFFDTIERMVTNPQPTDEYEIIPLQAMAGLLFPTLPGDPDQLDDEGHPMWDTGSRLIQLLLHRQTYLETHSLLHRERNLRDLATLASQTAWSTIHHSHRHQASDQQAVLTNTETYAIFNQIHGPLLFNSTNPEWANPTTTALARQIKASGDLSIIPILADALEEAGLANEDILHQLRHEPFGHTLSMWVLRQLTK